LRRRGFALHEGFEPKTLEGLRGILGAWSLELGARWMHGEFIHGATAILFCSGAFAWRRAHLRRRGALVFLLGEDILRASFCGERLSVSGSVYLL